jgi:hypothetical protein
MEHKDILRIFKDNFLTISFNLKVKIWIKFKTVLNQNFNLTPKGPMSVDGFLESSGRLSQHQKHEWSSEILKERGPM